MTDEKWFIKDEDGQYGEGILIDEYQGSWFLVSARQKNDGKVWMEWCFPQMRDGSKKPMDKSFPWKIKLGESDKEAGAKLRELADRIDPPQTGDNEYPVDGGDRGPEGTNPGDTTSDGEPIPF